MRILLLADPTMFEFVFAGDVVDLKKPNNQDDRIVLTNVVHVVKWQTVGLASLLKNPFQKNVLLEKLGHDIDLPASSEGMRILIPDGWGLTSPK